MKIFFIKILFLTCFSPSYYIYGQELSPLSISSSYTPSIPDHKYAFVSTKLNVSYPVIKSSNTILLTGINCKWSRNEIQNDTMLLNNLHYIAVPLSLVQNLNSNYRLYLSFETGISSERINFNPENFKYTANIAFIHSKGDTTLWSAILVTYRQFGGLSVSPNFYFNAHIFNKLYFSGALPFNPKFVWKANNKSQYGVGVSTDFNTFRLAHNKNNRYMEEEQADLNLFYQRRISKNFKISASIGYILVHKVKIYDKDETVPIQLYTFDSSRKPFSSMSPDGFIFKLRLFWSSHD